MRLWLALPLVLGLIAIMGAGRQNSSGSLVIIGEARGSLSPCGCTKPMVGGIRRLGTVVRQAGVNALSLGGFVNGVSRQNQFKTEALAQSYQNLRVGSTFASSLDLADPSRRLALENLLGDSLKRPGESWEDGSLVMVNVDASRTELAKQTVRQGHNSGRLVGLIIGGGSGEAQGLAELAAPDLVVFREDGRATWSRRAGTLLLCAGSKLRDVVRLSWASGKFADPEIVPLDERVPDDPEISRIYDLYLSRVSKGGLLAEVARPLRERYVGSEKCISCHTEAGAKWRASKHWWALRTLQKEGHDKDPDCVSCHVVGLSSKFGFRDATATPHLANVGCESCHAGDVAHSLQPRRYRMVKTGQASCMSCHTPDHSPGFDFVTYWRQIVHGSPKLGENNVKKFSH